jgi:TetR/AcrR family transcriptional repressor of nem operon
MIRIILYIQAMRYKREHKANTHKKIVEDAARRFRAEGLTGASVASVMQDTGLTHGGFYKHFPSKNDLLVESIADAFQQTARAMIELAEKARPGEAWKTIIEAYLSRDHIDHPDTGCALAALGAELARLDGDVKARLGAGLVSYKDAFSRFMPGKRAAQRDRAFFVIFSTMVGAVTLARMLPDQASRQHVLNTAKDFLLKSFS